MSTESGAGAGPTGSGESGWKPIPLVIALVIAGFFVFTNDWTPRSEGDCIKVLADGKISENWGCDESGVVVIRATALPCPPDSDAATLEGSNEVLCLATPTPQDVD